MSTYYTSELLIDSVKRRINIPTNQNTYSNADILAFADEELSLVVVPAIMTLHEDYLLFNEDQDLQESQSEYIIPYRAVGNKLYDLQFVDQSGNVISMTRSTMAEQPAYNGAYTTNVNYVYYVKNNRIVLMPPITGNAVGSLRFIYYIRPSSLVMSDEVGVINNINRTTGEITVNTLPEAFGTSVRFDLYNVRSPHNMLAIDLEASSVNSTSKTITLDPEDIPSDLLVGDHIALAQQCAIPQIPDDLHVFLAQKTAERILEAQGDLEGLKLAQAKSAEMEVRAGTIIDNRVEESPPKLVNRNSPLRYGMSSRLFRRRG
jgi:hypothetical protein